MMVGIVNNAQPHIRQFLFEHPKIIFPVKGIISSALNYINCKVATTTVFQNHAPIFRRQQTKVLA